MWDRGNRLLSLLNGIETLSFSTDGRSNEALEIDKSCGDCSGADVKCVEIKQNGRVFRGGSKNELIETESVTSYVDIS